MQILASTIEGLPVISLQANEAIAWAGRPLIDMANFKIIALHCEVAHSKQPLLLLIPDIRQLASDCVIIDAEDELLEPSDIIRLKPLVDANYEPFGKTVLTDTGRKLGIVEDYIINLQNSHIQKICVRPSLWRSWLGSPLIIDRSQIVDVTPKHITVREALIKAPVLQAEPTP